MNKESGINSRQGSLLIESIVAISVALVGILGVLALLSRSLGVSKDVGQQLIATYLAAEGIEVVKSLIDKDFVDGKPFNHTVKNGAHEVTFSSSSLATLSPSDLTERSDNFLLFNSEDGTYGYRTGEPTIFKRTVVIEEIDRSSPQDGKIDELKVNSIVEWSIRGTPQEINLEDHFFNWR